MATQPGVMGSIMDLFRGAPVNPNPNQGAPGQVQQSKGASPNGVVPPNANPDGTNQDINNQQPNSNNNQGDTGNTNTPAPTPLDQFAKLWEAPTVDPSKQNTGLDFQNVDPQKMMEAARKVDFSQILTPEIQGDIAKGGAEGVKATIAAMNQVAQLVYGQSAMAATKIVGTAVEQARTEFARQIPDLVKAAQLNNNLVKANPVFQNPAVAPIVNGLKDQLILKFPQATPDQLTSMAQEYFLAVTKGINPGDNNANNPNNQPAKKIKNMTGKGEEDWADFFGVSNS